MFKPKFTITNKINNALLEIERARGFLEAAEFKEEWIKGNGRTAWLLYILILYTNSYDFKRLFSLSKFYERPEEVL